MSERALRTNDLRLSPSRKKPRLSSVGLVLLSAFSTLLLTACAPETSLNQLPTQSDQAEVEKVAEPEGPDLNSTFVSVIDGDTIETSDGTVRIIGIDTPERGDCGYREAAGLSMDVLSPGDKITLELPSGQNDRDNYDRLLRYVTTADGTDLGLLQLENGYAVARYDSTDGYPAHPNQDEYHSAQTATLSAHGDVITPTCAVKASTPTATPPSTQPTRGDSWYMEYPSCGALKRSNSGDPTGPFNRDNPAEAGAYDWFANGTGNHGDGDGDGLACE